MHAVEKPKTTREITLPSSRCQQQKLEDFNGQKICTISHYALYNTSQCTDIPAISIDSEEARLVEFTVPGEEHPKPTSGKKRRYEVLVDHWFENERVLHKILRIEVEAKGLPAKLIH